MSWNSPPPPPPAPPLPSSNPQAVAESERIHAIDVVRGAALAGVLLANLMFAFRVPTSRGYLPAEQGTPWIDRAAEGLVQYLVQGKAITLFSFLFGVGLAIQYERFARLGHPRRWLARRLAVLLLVGAAHLTLAWNGDILTEYALSGMLVLAFLDLSHGALMRWAAALYAFYLVAPAMPFMPEWPDDFVMRSELADALRIYGTGTYEQIRRYSLHEWRVFSPIYLSLFTVTPALFLLGIAAWRSGIFRFPGRHLALLRWWAGFGMLGGAALTALSQSDAASERSPILVLLAAGLAPALVAAGYGAALLIAVDAGLWPRLLRALAAAGRMAFTNYLVQTLVFTTLFFGYGFGLIGQVDAAPALAGGIVFYALQVAASRWWLARWRFGPLEWVWRSLTYGRRQPFRRAAA